MKETKFPNHICWWIMAHSAIALSIAFAFFLSGLQAVKILVPVICKAVSGSGWMKTKIIYEIRGAHE